MSCECFVLSKPREAASAAAGVVAARRYRYCHWCGRLINARKHSPPNEWGVARTPHAIAVSAILANCAAML